jgi:hypothetical protein
MNVDPQTVVVLALPFLAALGLVLRVEGLPQDDDDDDGNGEDAEATP